MLQNELTELKRRLHKAEHDLLNAKEEWEKEKKRLIEENSTLREQLKILRSKQFGKSSEKTKKSHEKCHQEKPSEKMAPNNLNQY